MKAYPISSGRRHPYEQALSSSRPYLLCVLKHHCGREIANRSYTHFRWPSSLQYLQCCWWCAVTLFHTHCQKPVKHSSACSSRTKSMLRAGSVISGSRYFARKRQQTATILSDTNIVRVPDVNALNETTVQELRPGRTDDQVSVYRGHQACRNVTKFGTMFNTTSMLRRNDDTILRKRRAKLKHTRLDA